MNQCDGCNAGMPIKDGIHLLDDKPNHVCTRSRYLSTEEISNLRQDMQASFTEMGKLMIDPHEYPIEHTRLNHYTDLVARLAFVKQSMKVYRASVLNPNHYGSSRIYRRKFIQAYLDFKRYYLNHKEA